MDSPPGDFLGSGRSVRDHVRDGWELWHISNDMLPGRWELRRGRERKSVSWDAIEIVRRRYLGWMEKHTEAIQQGRNTWIYRPCQKRLALSGALS